jgi:phosphohistidine phosphatase
VHTLILLRHAKSDYPGGVTDHDRPLAPRGKHEAELAGKWLRAGRWASAGERTIDAVLCSTATRARQTLRRTDIDAPTEYTEALYGATADEILDEIRGIHDDVTDLLVVAHAPGLPDTAIELAGSGSDPDAVAALESGFPTSAIAVIDVSGPWADLSPETAALRMIHVPRD